MIAEHRSMRAGVDEEATFQPDSAKDRNVEATKKALADFTWDQSFSTVKKTYQQDIAEKREKMLRNLHAKGHDPLAHLAMSKEMLRYHQEMEAVRSKGVRVHEFKDKKKKKKKKKRKKRSKGSSKKDSKRRSHKVKKRKKSKKSRKRSSKRHTRSDSSSDSSSSSSQSPDSSSSSDSEDNTRKRTRKEPVAHEAEAQPQKQPLVTQTPPEDFDTKQKK